MSPKPKSRSRLPLYVGGGLMVLMAVCVWLLRSYLASPAPATKKVVQEVQVIRPPPPPPDTPPPPPPPPEDKVDIKDPPPEAHPDPTPSNEPPPGEQLGVDAAGSGAGDGFGLVGRKGGRDLLATGGGSNVKWYAGIVKNEVQDRLGKESQVRSTSFTVSVRLWIRDDGTVDRVQLVGSTGDAERDRAVTNALSGLRKLSQAPPAGMPQPITIKIVSRT